MDFSSFDEIPTGRKVTYTNFICDYWPLKAEKSRVRMTIGCDKLDYPDQTASPTAFIIEMFWLLFT